MDVTQAQQSTTVQATTPQTQTNRAISSDFETFLKMLTTQMENQDPLNPIESADFAVQLATFSGVEQQVQTNDLLRALTDGFAASGIGQLAGWVGMEARVKGPAYFQDAPIALSVSADPASDSAVLVVKDEYGAVVSREAFSANEERLLWAGVDDAGRPLPPGLYSFEVESLNQGEVTSIAPAAHYGLVREAQLSKDGIEIVLSGGIRVPSSEVTALRSPQSGI